MAYIVAADADDDVEDAAAAGSGHIMFVKQSMLALCGRLQDRVKTALHCKAVFHHTEPILAPPNGPTDRLENVPVSSKRTHTRVLQGALEASIVWAMRLHASGSCLKERFACRAPLGVIPF